MTADSGAGAAQRAARTAGSPAAGGGRSGPRAATLGSITALIGMGMVTACGASSPGPGATVTAFVQALGRNDRQAMAAQVDAPPPDFAATYAAAASDLGVTAATYTAGPAVTAGAQAMALLTSRLPVAGFGPLGLHSTLHLRSVGGHWRITWSSTAIADQLGPGDHFSVSSTWPARAPVLGAQGASLTPAGVSIGLVGQRITDPARLTSLLVGAGFPSGAVAADIQAATGRPTQLVPVGVLPLATYEALKAQSGPTPNLYSIGGTSFAQGAQAPRTAELGAHLVGTVGPVTADQLARLGKPYTATARVGQGGIEAQYERQLAGMSGVTVAVRTAAGATVATLGTTQPTPGRPVTTTLDPAVQAAAEAAMSGVAPTTQAAMVVLRASTGAVLASVSRPETTPFNLAFGARVPPGSTFKVVTATALLQRGATPATPATCPPSRTVNGQVFRNFEGEAALQLSLAQAFAVSCNTAFVGLAAGLPPSALPQAGALYGLGTIPQPGLPAAASSVPTPTDPNQQAGSAIGQAGIVVSPLAMASVAATVDAGAYRPPRLVVGAPDDSAPAVPLPAGVADALHTLMAGVTTGSGTAAGAGLPAGTYGKTGTAEFGPGPTPATHAWFIGFRGDLAFAVFVYGGGIGGTVAAPLAAKLLGALPPGT